MSPKSQELVSSTFIRQKSTSEGSKSESTSLRSRGRPMNVSVKGIHKLESAQPTISHKTLLDIQTKRNLSDIGTLHIAQDLRQALRRQGGGDVEPNFEKRAARQKTICFKS